MRIDACFQLGYLTGTRGLHGQMHARLDSDHPDNYQDLESVYILPKNGDSLIPFFIETLKIQGDKAILKFDEINSREQAKDLIGSELYLPLDQLPVLEGNSFYFHELVNWTVEDENLGKLGIISDVYQQDSQVLLVMDYQQREVLIPCIDEIVLGIDRQSKLVNVRLPNGLLEVYLNH